MDNQVPANTLMCSCTFMSCTFILLNSSNRLVSGPSGHLGGVGNRGQNTKGQYGGNQPDYLNFNLTFT